MCSGKVGHVFDGKIDKDKLQAAAHCALRQWVVEIDSCLFHSVVIPFPYVYRPQILAIRHI